MQLSISVVIPTFNRVKFLERALKSVVNQTFPLGEIIVVDNCSTDGTSQMIRENFNNIKYIFCANKGVSKARNMGIKKSNFEWICFLDSDDEWNLKKIEKQVNFLEKNKEIKFIHTNEVWYRNGTYFNQSNKHKKFGGNLFENSLKLCCISPSSVMMNKKIFQNHGLFDENLEVCEDYEMWLRISAKFKIGFLKEKLIVKYGGHFDQLSKKYWGMDRFRVYAIEKNILNDTFSEKQKILAKKYLLQKLLVIFEGAKKRKNEIIFQKYKLKYDFWKNYNLNKK